MFPARVIAFAALALVVSALYAPIAASQTYRTASPAPAYGWPVRPFHEQHPIRGNFGDPRIARTVQSFHFGVDVYAANGTAVYATQSGRASIPPRHGSTVIVRRSDGRILEYWHIVPSVRSGQSVTAYRTVIGHVMEPWAHVHFTERRPTGQAVNPLRYGAMGPYADATAPVVVGATFERSGVALTTERLRGAVDIVADTYDPAPINVPAPWGAVRVTPARLQWRVVNASGVVVPWRLTVSFQSTIPPSSAFHWVYAPGTWQNRPYRPARYRFYMAHAWNTAALRDGNYVVQVAALDIRGNLTVGRFPVTLDNR
jgi:hypothetical protein